MLLNKLFFLGATFAVIASALPAPIIPDAQNIERGTDDEAWTQNKGGAKRAAGTDDEAWTQNKGGAKRAAGTDDEAWWTRNKGGAKA